MNFGTPAAIFVSSFVIGLSGAMMPGPLLAVTIRHTTRKGFAAAPLLVLGHAILEGALLCLILFGVMEWIRGEAATTVIALLGSAMLLWMARGMAREVRTLRFAPGREEREDAAEEGSAAGGWFRPVLDGIVVSAANPYWSLWWATIGLGYLLLSRNQGISGIISFVTGHVMADVAWYFLVGSAVAAGRGWFTDRMYRGVVSACALFLVFFAMTFGYFGIAHLIRFL
jgi:threonine/homoserine/homoserine lactone efflux protein